jgi:hypothetical protein
MTAILNEKLPNYTSKTYPMGGGVGNGLSKPFLPNNQYVFILPLPFISIGPRDSIK